MQIKECYVSHNGISCITNINSLVTIKDIEFKSIINNKNSINNINNIINIINKNNLFFYIGLRIGEFIITDFIKNKSYLFDSNNEENILPNIIFS
tara:strand:- start:388 stop:672 length:285 start_codon:yes stop_codon:yes gene_type:complete